MGHSFYERNNLENSQNILDKGSKISGGQPWSDSSKVLASALQQLLMSLKKNNIKLTTIGNINSLPTKVIVIGGGLWMGSEIYRNLVLTSFRKIAKELGYNGNISNAAVSDAGVIGTAIYALDSLTN